MHADQIVAALAAGKHVSAQKPLAISVAEADRIATALARARTTFRVTENFLYYPPILKAKELLDSGAIGEPSLVRIHTTRAVKITEQAMELDPDAMVWRRDPGLNPGGPLYDDGAAVDFIDSLLAGRQPAQDIRTAKHILQVPLAIYEASRIGRPVAPDSIK